MKKLHVMILFTITMNIGFANDYLPAMLKGIEAVYQASDIPQLQKAVNTLERIGAIENLKWEPQYYTAFGYIMMANLEKEATKKDTYLDHAMIAIDKAKALAPAESEIIALEGFVHMMRVTVDPGSRGPEFAPRALQTFGKATALNPENPRALLLTARMQYGSAQFFGTESTEACSVLKKSLEKFDTYKSTNPLAPVWGKPMAESLLQQCK